MQQVSIGVAVLLALAIIAVGAQYIAAPRTATLSFGLPLPENGQNIISWLRLKGVRDIASGLTVLACLTWAGPWAVGIVLLALATIPVGDMLVVLSGQGSTKRALGMHGVTALVMALTGIPLLIRAS
jgi:hypothetical protein